MNLVYACAFRAYSGDRSIKNEMDSHGVVALGKYQYSMWGLPFQKPKVIKVGKLEWEAPTSRVHGEGTDPDPTSSKCI